MKEDREGQNSYFYIDFSHFLESDDSELIKVFYQKIGEEESFQKMLFPLYTLEDYNFWIDRFNEYLQKQKDLDRTKYLKLTRWMREKLNYIYHGFEIPYVTLSDILKDLESNLDYL